MHEFEQEFNKAWNRADYKQKKRILQEVDKIINRKESEKKLIDAFFLAVKNEKCSAVRKILKQNVNVNEMDDVLGNTALSHAVFARNIDIIKMLLEHGASPYVENNRGYNAMDAAKLIGDDEIIELISINT